MTPENAYSRYSNRWEIELVFRYFKNEMKTYATNVQDDYTVIDEEFINTIASTITCRLVRISKKKGLMKTDSYGDIMDNLKGVQRRANSAET